MSVPGGRTAEVNGEDNKGQGLPEVSTGLEHSVCTREWPE